MMLGDKMKANLHVHTTCSDGTKTIEEINELALKHGFDVIGITDHDTLNGIYGIEKLNTKVKFIMGIELSCKYKKEVIHVLGYFKNRPSDDLINYFKKCEKQRLDRCLKIIDNLDKYYGIKINYEDVRKKADGLIARPHIAEVIKEKYGYTIDEVFDNFIGDDKKAYVPYEVISLEEGIKLLKENDALVVLAHPILIKTFNYKEVINMGFDGIEVYHTNQDNLYSKELIEVAKENNLFITGGSDYHGEIIENKFEKPYIEGDDLDIFLNKLYKKS